MKIVELKTEHGRSIAHAHMAWSFKTRCIGLIRRRELAADEGLLLVPGGSVHTLAMQFPIDVVFLDRALRVIGLRNEIPPWRFVFAPAGTRFALELRAGRIAQLGLGLTTQLIACFDDEEGEEAQTTNHKHKYRLRQPTRSSGRIVDSVARPRPSSPCFAFSLRLPLRNPRAVRGTHNPIRREPSATSQGSADELA